MDFSQSSPPRRRRTRKNLRPKSVFDRESLMETFQALGVKEIHIQTLWKHIMSETLGSGKDLKLKDIKSITGFPQKALTALHDEYEITTSQVIDVRRTANRLADATEHQVFDGKLVVKLSDGKLVETVVIGHLKRDKNSSDTGEDFDGPPSPRQNGFVPGHVTVCVSSQIGCAMACTFCETGTMGMNGNLTAGEIMEQLYHVQTILNAEGHGQKVRNIVFMGMGEPLANYDEVVSSIKTMHECPRFRIGYSNITISTVGVYGKITQLAQDLPQVNLALSLHAPSQDIRLQIVPSAKTFQIDKLIRAVDQYVEATGRGIMMEYIVIGGVNDSLETAELLGQLLHGKHCWINLIPYNPTAAGARYHFVTPTNEQLQAFRSVVMKYSDHQGNPLKARVRWSTTTGREVDGACGQLALKNLKDIEDIGRPQMALRTMSRGERAPKNINSTADDTHRRMRGSKPTGLVNAKAIKHPQRQHQKFFHSIRNSFAPPNGAAARYMQSPYGVAILATVFGAAAFAAYRLKHYSGSK